MLPMKFYKRNRGKSYVQFSESMGSTALTINLYSIYNSNDQRRFLNTMECDHRGKGQGNFAVFHIFAQKSKTRFKRRATAVPNSIDRTKFDISTTVARRLKPSRATVVQHGKPCRLLWCTSPLSTQPGNGVLNLQKRKYFPGKQFENDEFFQRLETKNCSIKKQKGGT